MFDRKMKRIGKKGYKACVLAVFLLACALCGCTESGVGKTAKGEVAAGDKQQAKGQWGETDEAQASGEGSQEAGVVFQGRDMEGNTVSSDILAQSKLTMINVWATYCGPCLNEMPDLGELAGEYDSADFQLIGIISDVVEDIDEEGMGLAKTLIAETGADYTHLLLNESLFRALLTEVTAVPTTFFLDKDGNLLDTVVGSRDKAEWKEKIDGLLEGL